MKEILDRFRDVHVAVVGDIMLDHYIWGDAVRISPEAPVPVVSVFRDTYTAGGAANVALNLRGLGTGCGLCGTIGEDEPGRQLRDILESHGIQFIQAFVSSSRETIVKTRVIVQKQQMCRIDREKPLTSYAIEEQSMIEALYSEVDESEVIILSDYAKGTLTGGLLDTLKNRCKEKGKLLILDPKPKRRLPFENLDLLTPNRTEAFLMAGMEPESHGVFPGEEVCFRLRERWAPRYLVITLGADGMLVSAEPGKLKHIPTAAREVFDVSGAGDTVIATLGAALAVGADLETAARLANLAAGIVVAKVGTAIVHHQELVAAVETE